MPLIKPNDLGRVFKINETLFKLLAECRNQQFLQLSSHSNEQRIEERVYGQNKILVFLAQPEHSPHSSLRQAGTR